MKSSVVWQATHFTEACAPARAKPARFAWSKWRLIRAGFQPSSPWHSEQSPWKFPCGYAGSSADGSCQLVSAACDDGNPCTLSDKCGAGVCSGTL